MREFMTLKFPDNEEGARQKEQTQEELRVQGWAVQTVSRISSSNGSETLVEFYRDAPPQGERKNFDSSERLRAGLPHSQASQSRRNEDMDSDDPVPPVRRRRGYYADRCENRRTSRFIPGLLLGILLGGAGGFGAGWWLYGSPSLQTPPPESGRPVVILPQPEPSSQASDSPAAGTSVTAVPAVPAVPVQPAVSAPAQPSQPEKTAPEPAAEETAAERKKGVVTGSRVNIRHQPSTQNGRVLGQVERQQELTVLDQRDTGERYPWYQVSGSFGEGWIYGRYLEVR